MDPLARSEALRQHVRNACRALDFSEIKKQSAVTLSHLLYDDAHKVIYCYIPKVACTSWKRVMLKMNEMVPPELDIATLDRDMVHSHILPRLASSKNLEEKLKTYKKFMFVRHPFERAVSAYRNKLERDDKLFIGKEIKKMYRGTTEARGRNVAFAEFIRYISEPRPRTAEQRNEHWLPMHELCDPCSVKYDFIGTKENLKEDADYVLKWLGVTELVGAFPASDEPVNASQYVSRLPVCGHQRVLIMVMCLVTLLLVTSYFVLRWESEIAPPPADSLSQATVNSLTRSEALRQHVRNACRALDFSESKMQKVTLSHLLYDDTHKMIYCYIPKVACTSWKRVFLKTTGKLGPEKNITSLSRGKVHSIGLPRLASSKNPEEKLQTYKKFMFVRHPFERVLSAYRDKMEREDELYDFHQNIGKKIEKKYRGTTEAGGRNVTFREFIRYISEPGPGTAAQRNDHWLPMHELCDPCSVEYDFIGTKENLEEDGEYVLKWLGVTELVGRFPPPSKPVNASQYVSKYLKQLSHTERLTFYAKFLPDYLLFDYKFL